MNHPNKCPRCGKETPANAPKGICPNCLLQAGASVGEGEFASGSRPEPLPVEEVARRFPEMEILGLLGAGGMGAVYRARQPKLDRFIALKILDRAATDIRFVERFTREARTLARLSHPNIVALHDFGEREGLFFLTMDFVDGVTLRELLAEGKLAPEQALAIMPQICDALHYAHGKGVVHRDIKPENILLDTEGHVKVADFGIARLARATPEPNLTAAGEVIGTAHYMAPEQMENPREVDHRADIFALGVVFYEMLTGELPLGKFPEPSKRVEVDVRLDEVVLKALEKEPARRYQQASEVKTDVETIASSAGNRNAVEPGDATRGPEGLRSFRFAFNPFPALLPSEQVLHFKKWVWGMSGKSPPTYRLFFSLPPFCEAGLYVTNRRLIIVGSWLRLLNQEFNIWFSSRINTANVDVLQDVSVGRNVFGMYLETNSKAANPARYRSASLRLRIYTREAESLQRIILSAKSAAMKNDAMAAEPPTQMAARQKPDSTRTAAERERLGREIAGPARWLVTTGILNWVAIPMIVFITAAVGGVFEALGPYMILMPLAALVLSSAMILAGLKMKRLEAYPLAIIGSILAILVTPGNIIGLPVGIWCLVVLCRSEVREAFGGRIPPALLASVVASAASVPRPDRFWRRFAVAIALVLLALILIPAGLMVLSIALPAFMKSRSQIVQGEVISEVPIPPPMSVSFSPVREVILNDLDEARGMKLRYKLAQLPGGGDVALTGRDPVSLEFGPVIVRTLSDGDPAADPFVIDLDDGRIFTPPPRMSLADFWFAQNGIDAVVATKPGIQGLVGLDLRVHQVPPEQWDHLTPAALAGQMASVPPTAQKVMSIRGSLPATYLFQTREGGRDVLQITGFSESPRGVMIRYKLVGQALRDGEPDPRDAVAAKARATQDQVVVEDLALRMLAAIRDKEDDVLQLLAVDRVKGWRDSLPHFAFEMRERFQQMRGRPFNLLPTESIVEGDHAIVKCDDPMAANQIYLVLHFVRTEDGWKNWALRNSPPDRPLAGHLKPPQPQ